MSLAKTFQCPNCGSALEPQGSAAEIKCGYCGNIVIVPEELRAPLPITEAIGVSPQTTRWVKIGIWSFVALMVLSVVLPLVCSLLGIFGSICGVLVAFAAPFAQFFLK